MRVVGYVRELANPHEGEAAYAQAEQIRRWVGERGDVLMAICQDLRTPGRALSREGYRALLGILAAGEVDAVVVPTLDTLASDKVTQEISIWDLRRRGVTVLSTSAADIELLADPPPDQLRLIVRDVMIKYGRYLDTTADPPDSTEAPSLIEVDEASSVIVELVPAERWLRSASDPSRT